MTRQTQILIIEDNPDLLEVMSLLVENHFNSSVTIHNCVSFYEAQKILDNFPIDLTISDHQLSETETGADVLKYIIEKNIKSKFVLCSAYSVDTFPEFYPKGHIYFYIQKPDINEGIEQLLEKFERSGNELSKEINHNYSDSKIKQLSAKLNTIISNDNVPLNKKLYSTYLHAIEELVAKKIALPTFQPNKTVTQNRIDDFCKNIFFNEYFDKNQQHAIKSIYQFAFIELLIKSLDLDALTSENKLFYLCLAFPLCLEEIENANFTDFDLALIKKELDFISSDLISNKPKNQLHALMIISRLVTDNYFANNEQLNFLAINNQLEELNLQSGYYSELKKSIQLIQRNQEA